MSKTLNDLVAAVVNPFFPSSEGKCLRHVDLSYGQWASKVAIHCFQIAIGKDKNFYITNLFNN